jgi:hypothetical protein
MLFVIHNSAHSQRKHFYSIASRHQLSRHNQSF